MTSTVGHSSLVLAFFAALIGIANPLIAARFEPDRFRCAARYSIFAQFFFVTIAALALIHGLIGPDFSIKYVAFNTTRAGGNAPLFDQMLKGLNFGGTIGVVNGTTRTGSQALRMSTTTNQFIANGDVGGLANFLNSTSNFTGTNGGILRNGKLPENFIVVNPQFGSVALNGNFGNSTYNALETRLTKRMSQGLSGQFSYTFSKTLVSENGQNVYAALTA